MREHEASASEFTDGDWNGITVPSSSRARGMQPAACFDTHHCGNTQTRSFWYVQGADLFLFLFSLSSYGSLQSSRQREKKVLIRWSRGLNAIPFIKKKKKLSKYKSGYLPKDWDPDSLCRHGLLLQVLAELGCFRCSEWRTPLKNTSNGAEWTSVTRISVASQVCPRAIHWTNAKNK